MSIFRYMHDPKEMLKLDARKHYLRFYSILDKYDCGIEMCKQISSAASQHAE
jgi:hypothetical protein